jgi:hypothetical protein
MESDPLDHLKELVNIADKHTEVECGELLGNHFASVLLPLDETIVFVDKQYTTESGRTDIVVIGERIGLDGTGERVSYLWELKAPQVWLFEKETNSRVRPSDELYSAENQLLHYHSNLAGSETFRTHWNIVLRENIKIGGIIIGTQARFVNCLPGEYSRIVGVARTALSAREQAFYKGCGLRLWTWDKILQAVPSLRQSHLRISVSEQFSLSG